MKKSILAFVCMLALSAGSAAMAATESETSIGRSSLDSMLNQDHWAVSLTNIGFGVSTSQGLLFAAAPKLEYFVKDKFSVGGFVGVTAQTGAANVSSWELGPSATLHFLRQDRFEGYATGALGLTAYGASPVLPMFKAGVGMNYNFTPSFAVGPSVDVNINSQVATLNLSLVNLFLFL